MRDQCDNLPLWDWLKLLNMIFISSCSWTVEPPPSNADVWVYGFKSSSRIIEIDVQLTRGGYRCMCKQFLPPSSLPLCLPVLSSTFSLWTYMLISILSRSLWWNEGGHGRPWQGGKLYPQGQAVLQTTAKWQQGHWTLLWPWGEPWCPRSWIFLVVSLYKWPMHITGIQPLRAVQRIIDKQ